MVRIMDMNANSHESPLLANPMPLDRLFNLRIWVALLCILFSAHAVSALNTVASSDIIIAVGVAILT
ncbi:MAG: hypothetical protein ACRD1H_16860, partial [Vicinamibacterales bacterium]